MEARLPDTSYCRYLLLKLQEQREEGLYCDFSLHVEDQIFKVHKCILAANSLMMKTFLGSQPDNVELIVLTHTSAGGVRAVLDYMYTGLPDFLDMHVSPKEIWNAAKIFKMPELENMCKAYTECINMLSKGKAQGDDPGKDEQFNHVAGQNILILSNQHDGLNSVKVGVSNSLTSTRQTRYVSILKKSHNDNTSQQKTLTLFAEQNLSLTHQVGDDKSGFYKSSLPNPALSTKTGDVNDMDSPLVSGMHDHNVDNPVQLRQSVNVNEEKTAEGNVHEFKCETKAITEQPEFEFETITCAKQPAEICSAIPIKMEKAEDKPVVWGTSEERGELLLYKVQERHSRNDPGERSEQSFLCHSPAEYNDNSSDIFKSEIDSQRAVISENFENEIIHVEHPYAKNLCLDSESVVNSVQAESFLMSNTVSSSGSEQISEKPADHMDQDTKGGISVCVMCKRGFSTQQFLFQHLRLSHRQFCMPGKCLLCHRRFLYKQSLIKHMRSVHREISMKTCKKHVNDLIADLAKRGSKLAVKRADNLETLRPKSSCGFCRKVFKSQKTLHRHVKIKHQQLRFKCLMCRRAFLSQQSLRLHQKCVHQVKVSCQVCGEKFNNILWARKHRAEKHGKESVSSFACKFCNRKFQFKSFLQIHACSKRDNLLCKRCLRHCLNYGHYERHTKVDKHRSYSCNTCGNIFGKQCSLKKHRDRHNQQSLFFCQICKEKVLEVDRTSHLDSHKVSTTDSDGNISYHWECTICKKQMTCLKSYLWHKRLHENECDICGKGFIWPKGLQKHKATCRPMWSDAKFTCDKCGKCFPSVRYFKTHILRNVCGDANTCPFCGEVYKKYELFLGHVRKHKVATVHASQGAGKYFKCPVCDQVIKKFCYLRVHLQMHQSGKPYKCEHCNKGFMREGDLKMHLAVTHDEPVAKVHICNICKKKMRCPAELATHMTRHTGHKPAQCKLCGKRFRSDSALKRHMLQCHECEECGETFKKKEDKLAHEETAHSDLLGRYVCDICGKLFSFPNAFQKHKKGHRNKMYITMKGGKPFCGKCDVCGKSFQRRDTLQRHVKKCRDKQST